MMTMMFGALAGGRSGGGQSGVDSTYVSLTTPRNGAGSGGSWSIGGFELSSIDDSVPDLRPLTERVLP